MKKSILLALLFVASVWSAEYVAFVKTIYGEASLIRGEVSRPLIKGESLYPGDRIETSKGAMAAISFNDGSRVSIGSSSRMVLDEYVFAPSQKKYRFDLSLEKGRAVFESGKIGKLSPESVQVKVPQGIIGIRGTKFAVEAE